MLIATKAKLIKAVNWYERDLAGASPKQLEEVTTILRVFMADLRLILKTGAPEHYDENPGAKRPCDTCAFNPRTDHWKGFAATAYGLVVSFLDRKFFMCHQGHEGRDELLFDLTQLVLCGGFKTIILSDAEKCVNAAERAMDGIKSIVPNCHRFKQITESYAPTHK